MPASLALDFYQTGEGQLCYKPHQHSWPITAEQLDEERNCWEEWIHELDPLLRESKVLAPYLREATNLCHGTPSLWLYAIANAAAWPALAGVLKTYLTRRSGRRVIVYGVKGKKLLEVTGDLTAAEIEALLKARVAPLELGGAPQLDEAQPDDAVEDK